MCGFIGEFGNSQSPKNKFNSLLKLSSNRGPDMVGYYSNLDIKTDEDPYIQFGFNRLSIFRSFKKCKPANNLKVKKVCSDV